MPCALLKRIVYHILFPLVIGLAIYLFLREPITYLHKALGIQHNLAVLPESILSNFILFYLPDMLWAYALTAALLLVSSFNRVACATLALVLLSMAEAVQANWKINQLDWLDMGLMAVSVFLAIIITRK